jgi:hypothetical protein
MDTIAKRLEGNILKSYELKVEISKYFSLFYSCEFKFSIITLFFLSNERMVYLKMSQQDPHTTIIY